MGLGYCMTSHCVTTQGVFLCIQKEKLLHYSERRVAGTRCVLLNKGLRLGPPRALNIIVLIAVGLGLGPQNGEKKGACPARVAEAGQENIETVHEPKPIQAAETL